MRTRIIFFFMILCTRVRAQDEWLATLNYSNLSVNRIANIPGVTWVTADNSTYDENNQRFFFQGNANRTSPWYLHTVSAITGATLYDPLCPSNIAGQVEGFNMIMEMIPSMLFIREEVAFPFHGSTPLPAQCI